MCVAGDFFSFFFCCLLASWRSYFYVSIVHFIWPSRNSVYCVDAGTAIVSRGRAFLDWFCCEKEEERKVEWR